MCMLPQRQQCTTKESQFATALLLCTEPLWLQVQMSAWLDSPCNSNLDSEHQCLSARCLFNPTSDQWNGYYQAPTCLKTLVLKGIQFTFKKQGRVITWCIGETHRNLKVAKSNDLWCRNAPRKWKNTHWKTRLNHCFVFLFFLINVLFVPQFRLGKACVRSANCSLISRYRSPRPRLITIIAPSISWKIVFFHYVEAFLHQESYNIQYVCWVLVLYSTPLP